MWISKYVDLLASLVVGITFLFSGVVKLNDPRGFAYKIEEYLHLFASQLTIRLRLLIPYTVTLSVCIATLEVVLGVALLVHWQRFWILSALLSLTFFFYLPYALYCHFKAYSELRVFWRCLGIDPLAVIR